jgi:hypothetical protein
MDTIKVYNKEATMSEESGFKSLVGRKMSKEVKFMDAKVKISKLSVAEVLEIQKEAKGLEENDEAGFGVLRTVIKSAVEGAEDLDDDAFAEFPMDELSKLSAEIMKYSGIGEDQGK